MTYSDALVDFTKGWEGLKLVPSEDPLVRGIIDVGHGHVIQPDEERRRITVAEADELLRWDLMNDAEEVEERINPGLEQNQFDALLAFTFNLGIGAFAHSTLLRYINAGDLAAAAEEFPRWVRASGRVVQGLVKRRAAERAMFLSADYSGRP